MQTSFVNLGNPELFVFLDSGSGYPGLCSGVGRNDDSVAFRTQIRPRTYVRGSSEGADACFSRSMIITKQRFDSFFESGRC
jgi:hypothetical protein